MDKKHLQHMIIAEIVRARNNGLSVQEVHDAVRSGLAMTQHLPGAKIPDDENRSDSDEN